MRYLILTALAVVALSSISIFAQAPPSKADRKTVSDFDKRVKRYVALRETLRKRQPKLSENAKPEQIQEFKIKLRDSVQAARVNAKQGDVFTQQASRLIKTIIASEFKGWERSELRKIAFEIDPKGIPVKVNIPYPESKELVEMSPKLLLLLPQMPKELRYRFIGPDLAILDRDNALIIDFIKKALP